MKTLMVLLRRIVVPAAAVVLAGLGLWCVGAAYYALSWPVGAVAGYAVGLLALWILAWRLGPAWVVLAIAEGGVLVYFLALTPGEVFAKTAWQMPWRYLPMVRNGESGRVEISNVRDFVYRTENDYTPRLTRLEIDPAKVASVDLALSHWDDLEAVAHTMLRFNFDDGKEFVVSMETRLPEGVGQGALPGIYKRYGLLMLVGTSRDLFDLRSKYRGETLYIYRTNATREQSLLLLRAVLTELCRLERHPAFYNSVTDNCTTSLVPLLRVIGTESESDFRLLCNGFSDQMLFQLGYLKHRKGESFGSLKSRSYVPGKSGGAAD